MLILYLIFLFFSDLFVQCAYHDTDEKIVGGEVANRGEHPFMVSLQKISQKGMRSHFCGGALIEPGYVATAAHCVMRTTAGAVRVLAGLHDLSKKEFYTQERAVAEITIHPNYSFKKLSHDMAIIKLAAPFLLGKVNTVELPESCSKREDDQNCTVFGWGATSESGRVVKELQKVKVPLFDKKSCSTAYSTLNYTLDDTMLCAGTKEGGKDSCQGDSGGPLVCGKVLTGVVSWGYGCARAGYPGIYAKVCKFVKWIKSITHSNELELLIGSQIIFNQ